MTAIYHWLVFTGGLWYAVVGWAVAWLMGLAVAWRPFKKHLKHLEEHNRLQREQNQLLREIRFHVARPGDKS